MFDVPCATVSKLKRNISKEEDKNTNMTGIEKECSLLKHNFSWIGRLVPCFGISGKNVTVITQPSLFYETLKLEAKNAKKRICLASLYLGTGKLEKEMVECLEEAIEKAKDPEFKMTLLFDYMRGSRGQFSSRSMFLPMMKKYGDKVQLSLFHTPNLRGFWKKILPDRFNETIGVSHIKVYLFDNNLILSGANLSESYFTNRQDRYVMFRNCPELADFFHELVNTVSSLSFQVLPDNSEVMLDPSMPHPFAGGDGGDSFKIEANRRILDFLIEKVPGSRKYRNQKEENTIEQFVTEHGQAMESSVTDIEQNCDTDTWVYPLIQMGPFRIKDDEIVTQVLLKTASSSSRLHLASGYFNLTSDYMNVILNDSVAKFNIIMASPQVNGFYRANGISGAIPDAYTFIAKNFYERSCQLGQQNRLRLFEYYRDQWTFHVKGLWYYLPMKKLPSLTLIGSPNFGYRSVYRDLEAQVAIVTENIDLQEQLQKEYENMHDLSEIVSQETFEHPERLVPRWVTYVTNYIRTFF